MYNFYDENIYEKRNYKESNIKWRNILKVQLSQSYSHVEII